MTLENMFMKKSKSKSSVHLGSKESLDGSGNQSSASSENLSGSRDMLVENGGSIYRSTQFELHYLGMVQDVNLGGIKTRDPDIQMIDKIEEAQLEGKIHPVPRLEDQVILTISKHGVKVFDKDKKDVHQRLPLHNLAQIVHYHDGYKRNNVALKIGQVGRSVYDCYVFQCHTQEQAKNVCSSLKSVFDIITNHAT